ncbi:MAG: MATE family efflux transporter, partial [Planctomycetota bacterium]
IFLGSVFFVLVSLCNAILLANGDSQTFSKVLVIGFCLNLILDPWFLYGGYGVPAMGVAGIAWATVVIQAISSIFMLFTVFRRKLIQVPTWKCFLPMPDVFREIIIQAVPASFNIMSVALGFFVVTFYLKAYGEQTVAAFGVATRIEQIGLLPTFGLYSAIMALVGQNNGAKKFGRVLDSIKFCNKLGLIINISTSVLIFIFARPLMKIFTSDVEVIEIGVHYTHIMMLIQWSYVMTSTHLAFLQAIKRPFYGFFESVLRKVLLPLGFILFLAQWERLGVDSVWYGVAIANIGMTIVTVIYTWRLIRSECQNRPPVG